MGHSRAVKLADNLFAIDAWMEEDAERLACYLFDTPERVLVEVGPSATLHHLTDALEDLGIDDIATIVVTHIHIDHAGGAGQLARRYPKAKIGTHRLGARHLVNPDRLWASAVQVFGEEWLTSNWGPMEPIDEKRVIMFDEGDRIPLGGGRFLEVMHTPGHAKHHVVFHDDRTGGMFVGDSVGLCYPHGHFVQPVTPPPDFDASLVVRQMHRMLERDPAFLGFAHFGPNYDVADSLASAEQRIWDWVSVVEAMADLDDEVATAELKRWSRRRYLDLGFAAADIDRYEAKTFWPMQVAGIRRWLATREATEASPE
jgi:glyoxylase-like metal-dependent hydrolase (beta-lactamase superfamily II)